MTTNDLSSKLFLKMTRVIFLALCTGWFTFLILVLYVNDSKLLFNFDISDPLILSAFFAACVLLPTGYLIAKKSFKSIDPNDLMKDKLLKYQSGQLIRLATCEGVGLLAIVGLLLTSNLVFLFFLLIASFVIIQYYPTPDKIGREINLTQNEIDSFYD